MKNIRWSLSPPAVCWSVGLLGAMPPASLHPVRRWGENISKLIFQLKLHIFMIGQNPRVVYFVLIFVSHVFRSGLVAVHFLVGRLSHDPASSASFNTSWACRISTNVGVLCFPQANHGRSFISLQLVLFFFGHLQHGMDDQLQCFGRAVSANLCVGPWRFLLQRCGDRFESGDLKVSPGCHWNNAPFGAQNRILRCAVWSNLWLTLSPKLFNKQFLFHSWFWGGLDFLVWVDDFPAMPLPMPEAQIGYDCFETWTKVEGLPYCCDTMWY